MTDCAHDYWISATRINDECILYVKCRSCEQMVTAAGVVSDSGGGYSVIEAPDRWLL